jgi:glycosyltransferase involved in cell wall biosynthesis
MIYFSIITINKNNAQGLEKTIESVIEQTYSDLEFIIIDGKSEDESVAKIKQYEDRISFWTSEKDTGIYNAMNKGIKKATGKYCLFLNSGDYLYNNNILKEIVELNFVEDIISGNVIKYSGSQFDQEPFSRIRHSAISLFDLYANSLNHQATFISRDLFIKYGFYQEKYAVISDWVFMVKALISYNATFKYINKTISYYSEGGISNGKTNYFIDERIPALNEMFPARIIIDYEVNFNKDYIKIYNRLKEYKLCYLIFKSLNFMVLKYENIFKKSKIRNENL